MSQTQQTPITPELIAKVKTLAEAAGREILRYYKSGHWDVTAKADDSPLTQADLAANQILVPGLRALVSEPIVSEESDPQSVSVSSDFWLIDPLDGTRDFVAKRDTFVVCVGLVRDFYPYFGVIHSPVTGETWWAAQGQGCFGPDGKRLHHSLWAAPRRSPPIVACSRSTPSERMLKLYEKLGITEIQRYGSALKFCKLAEGEVDLYPRFGPTCEWDTAAGQIIAEEAGCKVLSLATGERLAYAKPKFFNDGGFVASRSDLDVISLLKANRLSSS